MCHLPVSSPQLSQISPRRGRELDTGELRLLFRPHHKSPLPRLSILDSVVPEWPASAYSVNRLKRGILSALALGFLVFLPGL